MISGSHLRSTLLAAIATFGVVGVFGARAAVPAQADPPRAARQAVGVSAAVAMADATLAALEATLGEALDDARGGAALVLAGEAAPDEQFDAAARTLEMAGPSIVAARSALHRVAQLGASSLAPVDVPRLPISEADAQRLAAELRASGTTAAAVASLRHASDDVLGDLERALAGASNARPDGIEEGVAAARAALPAVERWNDALPTLAVWTSAMGSLLDSLADIATALRSGDAAALAGARDAYGDATREADRADRGLAIALAEAAASIGGGAPAMLASELAQLADCRAAVASVVLSPTVEGAAS